MTFTRCGLARLSDLETQEWEKIFSLLEVQQEKFSSRSPQFFSDEYYLSRDPLHTWSRCWEYPYIYQNMVVWAGDIASDTAIRVVDIGSGVTFFPFLLASRGFHVTGVDLDPVVKRDMLKAIHIVPHVPGIVDFKLADSASLPIDDHTVDAVYCISVLEHISAFEQTISEISRILRPGGALFLTFDIDLRGDHDIGSVKYYSLKAELTKYFEFLYPETTVHPTDILKSTTGRYGYIQRTKLFDRSWFFLKQNCLKPLLGRPPGKEVPYYLAVEGLTMRKKLLP
jgi:SAM-dependent methyltransferase